MGEMTHDREKVAQGLRDAMEVYELDDYCENAGDWVAVSPMLVDNAITLLSRPPAVWQYYTNDEGKARWRCSACGKVCRRDPRDKKYCSACGAGMRMEA